MPETVTSIFLWCVKQKTCQECLKPSIDWILNQKAEENKIHFFWECLSDRWLCTQLVLHARAFSFLVVRSNCQDLAVAMLPDHIGRDFVMLQLAGLKERFRSSWARLQHNYIVDWGGRTCSCRNGVIGQHTQIGGIPKIATWPARTTEEPLFHETYELIPRSLLSFLVGSVCPEPRRELDFVNDHGFLLHVVASLHLYKKTTCSSRARKHPGCFRIPVPNSNSNQNQGIRLNLQ